MTVVLINPNLVVQRNDRFTTGIVYMPIGLAYVAAALRAAGFPVKVIDAFGQHPRQSRVEGKFMVVGLRAGEVIKQIPDDTRAVFIYANQVINHASLVDIIREIKKNRPSLPVVVLENTQAVTAYALRPVARHLFECGADYLLTGEGEHRSVEFIKLIHQGAGQDKLRGLDGLIGRDFDNPAQKYIEDLDDLPQPAWDLFPIQNYWSLRFAHGPLTSDRYLPLLTSRGCPYPCKFCVVPATNDRKWRSRSAKNVVDEIEHMMRTFGVHEFHLEDLNPTINDKRIRAICQEIIDRRIDIVWKIVAGTKVESIKNGETIDLMARSGCRYISISPESGSAKVLKLIDKPFKNDHAVRLIKRMNEVGIRSQACFVLGFPGEDWEDRYLTWTMAKEMTRNGVDEIALFIISPVPGSKIFDDYRGYASLSDLNFTPTWREDYRVLSKFRLKLYLSFLIWKLRYYPLKIVRQIWNFMRRRFETKMEMVPYKALIWRLVE